MKLHDVQVCCAPGDEEAARLFYGTVLGLLEVAKPPELAKRGGCWFRGDAVEVHVGVEEPFHPAQKAHPAFLVEQIDPVAELCAQHGFEVRWDENFPPYRRFHTRDGHGNRVEILGEV